MTIAFYLPGGVPVYTFSLLLGLGATLGLIWVVWRAPEKQALRYLDAGLLALLGGLLGGRAGFVAATWNYYQHHAVEIFALHRGGYSWAGALAGGLLALALVAVLKHISLGLLSDAMLPLLATLTVASWLGCWLGGCAYGPKTDHWFRFPVMNEWGQTANRVPTQLLGAVLTLVLFWCLDWIRTILIARGRPAPPGIFALLGLLLLSLEMLALSYLRVDFSLMWNGLRLEAWAALGFAVLAALLLIISLLLFRIQRKTVEKRINPKG